MSIDQENQEAEALYQRIRAAMTEQGRPAAGEDGNCRYLTYDGRRCAVGCLIPPEVYDPEIEGAVVCRGLVTTDGGVWSCVGGQPNAQALVKCLNAAGVPATSDVLRVLDEAQWFHDCRWRPDMNLWPSTAEALLDLRRDVP